MPAYIQTHYQQYKHDTAQFSTWLAKKAVDFGFPLESFKRSDAPPDVMTEVKTAAQAKNAKKKARAKAKAKQGDQGNQEGGGEEVERKDTSQPPAKPLTGNYILTISQYLEKAQYIVDKGVQVPVEVSRLLKRCINLRGKTSARYASPKMPPMIHTVTSCKSSKTFDPSSLRMHRPQVQTQPKPTRIPKCSPTDSVICL